ncbi:MAG: hypothetical protein JNK82_02285 [Myxococcaceae bacterium]|nr:hypothetical protein [Myxococcaceae bacterium]
MGDDDAGLLAIWRNQPLGRELDQSDVNRLIRSDLDGTSETDLAGVLDSGRVSGFPRTALEMYVRHHAIYRASLNYGASLWKSPAAWYLREASAVTELHVLQASRLLGERGGWVDARLKP